MVLYTMHYYTPFVARTGKNRHQKSRLIKEQHMQKTIEGIINLDNKKKTEKNDNNRKYISNACQKQGIK